MQCLRRSFSVPKLHCQVIFDQAWLVIVCCGKARDGDLKSRLVELVRSEQCFITRSKEVEMFGGNV